ncbi:energy transducer TonB [Bradyrhizobium sp. STM 3809]|uniref:energy transducer TonB family protein n=1 Tax=Bradyrhizobium sp. STM 3809 TaxID=551936 RepID=UPI00024093EF|nr:energy transducer TonB [Bradyrhizobium sp. STM 3809]CCE01745.1 Energy transducer [Bradyrhizobium sp. STM 3809]
MSVLTLDPFDHEERRERTLWTTAAISVAVLHVGLVAGYLLLRPVPDGRAQADAFDVVFTPAVVSEPAPTVQEAPQAEPAPPQPKEELAKEEPVAREAVAEPVPQAQPDPEPQVMAQPDPTPQVALAPEPPRADDVVLPPPPPPKPIEASPEPKPAPAPEHVERKPLERKDTKAAERKPAAPKPVAAPPSRPARVAAAPNAGADSDGAREGRASWNSEFIAHFRRYNTISSGSKEGGTVSVSAVIARNGRLVSRRIASSSGSPTVDRAALELVDRAQPFPPFPPAMTQSQISLAIPIRVRPQ